MLDQDSLRSGYVGILALGLHMPTSSPPSAHLYERSSSRARLRAGRAAPHRADDLVGILSGIDTRCGAATGRLIHTSTRRSLWRKVEQEGAGRACGAGVGGTGPGVRHRQPFGRTEGHRPAPRADLGAAGAGRCPLRRLGEWRAALRGGSGGPGRALPGTGRLRLRIRRASRPPDRSRRRRVLDALPVRALRVGPDTTSPTARRRWCARPGSPGRRTRRSGRGPASYSSTRGERRVVGPQALGLADQGWKRSSSAGWPRTTRGRGSRQYEGAYQRAVDTARAKRVARPST